MHEDSAGPEVLELFIARHSPRSQSDQWRKPPEEMPSNGSRHLQVVILLGLGVHCEVGVRVFAEDRQRRLVDVVVHRLLYASLVQVEPRNAGPRWRLQRLEGLLNHPVGFFPLKNKGENLVDQVGNHVPILVLLGLRLLLLLEISVPFGVEI